MVTGRFLPVTVHIKAHGTGRVDLTVFVEEQSGLRIRLEFNLTYVV